MKACVGCGHCCLTAQCVASVTIHGRMERCPSLEWNGTRYVCALMRLPGDEGAKWRKELYAGAGCCSPLNTWRRDVRQRDKETLE